MEPSETIALPLERKTDREEANKKGILGLIPGIALLAVVGYAGKFIEQSIARYGKAHHLVLPNIEYVLWAILIGLVIGNTVGVPRIFRAGVATYEFWLKAGIILLGARFILGDILHLSGISFVLIFIELVLALLFMTYLGRAFRLSPKLISLLAVGSSVCGVSAIIATQGAIEATEEDSSVAIAAILALGAISLVFFPLVGHTRCTCPTMPTASGPDSPLITPPKPPPPEPSIRTLRANSPSSPRPAATPASASSSSATRSTGRARARPTSSRTRPRSSGRSSPSSSSASSPSRSSRPSARSTSSFTRSSPASSRWASPRPQIAALGNLSRWAFLLTFAGVGLRTSFKDLLKQGVKPFLVGAIGEIVIALITLGLVLGADRLYHL